MACVLLQVPHSSKRYSSKKVKGPLEFLAFFREKNAIENWDDFVTELMLHKQPSPFFAFQKSWQNALKLSRKNVAMFDFIVAFLKA